MYKALYRQYRPVNFDDVFGQDIIVKTLRNSIKKSSYSHAYMFFGPRGTGKTSVSKIFARSLNCLNPIDGNACGKCNNCLHSYQKECVDIIEIDAASNNGVDEIRELKNKISLVPADLKYKVYIIDEVHMLSIGAFNALLKTLEEPPEHVIFILATTDPQKVPETIISRCQCFSFKRISTEKIMINLKQICVKEKINIDDDVLEEISFSCDGGMRDALSSLDQLNSYCEGQITLEDYAEVNGSLTTEEINNFYYDIFERNYANILTKIKTYNESGKNIITILDRLMRYLRNLIVKHYIDNENLAFSLEDVHRLVLMINEKMFDIKKSSNPTVYVEMILLEFMNSIGMDFKKIKLEEIDDSLGKSLKMDDITSKKDDELPSKTLEIKEDSSDKNTEKNYGKNEGLEANEDVNLAIMDIPKISNIGEIMDVRVNNTLAKANKQLLINEISKLDMFNDYTFDQEIGYICCSILDAKIRAVSDENIIISYEFDSVVKQNLNNINKIMDIYNNITNSNKKIAIITDKQWEDVKKQYIYDIKNGKSWNIKNEPEEVFIEQKKDDIINNKAIELFGDIVEID